MITGLKFEAPAMAKVIFEGLLANLKTKCIVDLLVLGNLSLVLQAVLITILINERPQLRAVETVAGWEF